MTQSPNPEQEEALELAIVVEHVRRQVRARSLRAVAKELGMSPSGLRGVLDGAQPYGKTRDALRGWFARERGLDELPPSAAEDTVLALMRGLNEPAAGALAVLEVIEETYAADGIQVPTWVEAVRRRVASRVESSAPDLLSP